MRSIGWLGTPSDYEISLLRRVPSVSFPDGLPSTARLRLSQVVEQVALITRDGGLTVTWLPQAMSAEMVAANLPELGDVSFPPGLAYVRDYNLHRLMPGIQHSVTLTIDFGGHFSHRGKFEEIYPTSYRFMTFSDLPSDYLAKVKKTLEREKRIQRGDSPG